MSKIVSLNPKGDDLDVETLIAMINEHGKEIESFVISVSWKHGTTEIMWSEMTGNQAAWHDLMIRQEFIPVFLNRAREEYARGRE